MKQILLNPCGFGRLPMSTVFEALFTLPEEEELTAILNNHIITGDDVRAEEITDETPSATLERDNLIFTVSDGFLGFIPADRGISLQLSGKLLSSRVEPFECCHDSISFLVKLMPKSGCSPHQFHLFPIFAYS